jgi:hypothetical protein
MILLISFNTLLKATILSIYSVSLAAKGGVADYQFQTKPLTMLI